MSKAAKIDSRQWVGFTRGKYESNILKYDQNCILYDCFRVDDRILDSGKRFSVQSAPVAHKLTNGCRAEPNPPSYSRTDYRRSTYNGGQC